MQSQFPIQILVVEDNLVVSDNIKFMLSKMTYELVESVVDYESAVYVLEREKIQLVLIDILLASTKTGIELGAYIRKNYQIPFIFITSNSDKSTVASAKLVNPNGYLVKPFEAQDLFTAIEIALFNYNEQHQNLQKKHTKLQASQGLDLPKSILTDSIFIKKQHIFHRIPFVEIQFIKSDNVYLEVYTTNTKFLVRSTLKDYLTKLPNHIFYRAHKSFIVNIEHIQALNVKDVIVANRSIPISKEFKDFLIRAMNS